MFSIKEIKSEEMYFKKIVQHILCFTKNKLNEVEVYIYKTRNISVNSRKYHLENVEFNNSGTIAITIYNKYKKVKVMSTNFNLNSINQIIEQGIDISNYVSIDKYNKLPDVNLLAFNPKKLNLFSFTSFDLKNILKTNILVEQSGFNYNKKIVNTEGTTFTYSINTTVIGNTLGLLQSHNKTLYSLSTNMIANDTKSNMQSIFCYTISRDIKKLDNPKYLGQKTAKRAINKLFPKKIMTKRLPIIFASDISSNLFTNFSNAINGYNIYKKSSFLIYSLEKKIFPSWLTIIESPHIDKGLSSNSFDKEGVITNKKIIVSNGKLNSWILDSYSSRQLGLQTTGNAGGIHNWVISYDSSYNFKQLLKYMYKGILVTELMGQGVNLTTGDYSKGASGFFIDKGEIQYPIDEFTISGNLQKMFLNILKISNDINLQHTIQCGSVLLLDMQISGK